MHRFYTVRSFDEVLRHELCLAALFLAAKVHDHHLQLEQVIKAGNFSSGFPHLDVKSEVYLTKMKGVLFHEEILISVLGFCLDVMHPHPFVVLVCKAIKASEELSEDAYILATQSIINTTMSLKISPRTVACICIHAACKIFSYK
ncbi:cyclin-T1, partial [Trichonephila clavata]